MPDNPPDQAEAPSLPAALTSDTEVKSITMLVDPLCNAFTEGQHFEVANRDALPFRHVKNIGRGSSAVIEMVAHKPTNQLFALKTFGRYHGRLFEQARRAFDNEVSIMQRLSSHAHVIKVCATYVCDREQGIVLSPVASDGDLGAFIGRILDGGMKREQELILNRAFGCLVSGLAYIHKQTIRHKDIKPQNVLIHNGRVIYTDFGLAFDAYQQDSTTVGHPGAFTRRYCAPEVNDWGNRNRKSDIYSLGCVFVEILDVLEPEFGFRYMDKLPYFEKLEEIRRRLAQAGDAGSARKDLCRISHDMLERDQNDRIDTGGLLARIASLASPEDETELSIFCDECAGSVQCDGILSQDELVDDSIELSVDVTSTTDAGTNPDASIVLVDTEAQNTTTNTVSVDVEAQSATANIVSVDAEVENTPASSVSVDTEAQSTTTKATKKSKKKKTVSSIDIEEAIKLVGPPGDFTTGIKRYYCTKCGEMGHTSSKCPNACRACGELYHKSADCPNKCWTCDKVGHKARNCPNECDACDEIGHPTEDCPNKCWTCGEVGHFERNCQDECFICGRLGHRTQKCWGKCHKCGRIGHWKKDCADACPKCGRLGHWASDCPNKKRKGKRGNACNECGGFDHREAQCPEKKRGWQPIFEQVPQGPYQLKSRRQN